jgi:hypothetical protein
MPYSALNSAHGVKTASMCRTENMHKISHIYYLVLLFLLCVPSIHRMPSSVPSSVPCLSTYYIRECLVCRVIPWFACVRLSNQREMCTDAFGGNPKLVGERFDHFLDVRPPTKTETLNECNHGRCQRGRRRTFGARGDRLEGDPDTPHKLEKRHPKGYGYPFSGIPNDVTTIIV